MKIMFSALSLACAGLLASAAAAAYAADAAPSTADVAAACKPDVEKYCPGIKPGDGTLKACMKEHRKELSPDCKKELMEARKAKQS